MEFSGVEAAIAGVIFAVVMFAPFGWFLLHFARRE